MASNPYLSEIQIFAFNFAPHGWALCSGQTLPINQNQALFSLLGTTYGGNGVTTFLLPNLNGRVPMHIGNGFTQGQIGGEEVHTLTISEMAVHNHTVNASSNNPSQTSPGGNIWSKGAEASAFINTSNGSMSPGTITSAGGNQSHENRMPYLTLNFCIAVLGIFPSRN